MAPAAVEMAEALAETPPQAPSVPILSNVTVHPTQNPADISRLLVEQVTGRVRWRESIDWFASQGALHFIEVGAGTVLTGMSKRIAPNSTSMALSTRADMEAFAALLGQ